MYEVGLGGSIDFDLDYNGAGSDVGIIYSVAPGCELIIAVSPTTGVVTPLAVGVGVVLVRDSANRVVARLPVSVLPADEASIRQQISSGTVSLAQGIASANANP